ncbi:MAG: DNA primase [bacterium]|nr:DNA primase [bacterium]
MYYPEDIVEEVRQRNDIVDVIGNYVKLQKKGSSYMGLCPFHNEKSPSFSVSGQKQMYHCFGCGVGGNVFTFIMEYENYSFVEALKMLAERSGVELPEVKYSEEAKRQADIKGQLLEINKEAAKYYFYQLKKEQGAHALKYLSDRELSHETMVKFGLGYSNKTSNDLYLYLKNLGYSDEILRQSGLITYDEKRGIYDKFWNRVMFPIMDANNKVIGFGGRVMGEGTPKYLNSPETKVFDKSRNLYGMNLARVSRKPNMIICEGYMDVIALHQAGFNNAVASLGTAFTGLQANLLKRYTKEVLITYDSDAAGTKAALRAIPILKEAGLSTRVINMKPYKDPDEFIKALGAEEFQKRIDNAINSFYFEIEVLEREFDLNDPESKTKFFNEIAKKMLVFSDELERNNYVEAVAKKYNISFDNLRKLVNRYGAQLAGSKYVEESYNEDKKKYKKQEDGIKESQKILLTWLIEDAKLFPLVMPVVSEDDFIDPLYHTVASMLFSQYRETNQVTPAKIINHFESKEEQNEVASLFNTSIREQLNVQEREKALNETIYRIKKNSLDNASRTVTDIKKLQEIIKAQADLQKLHISLNRG